MYSKHIETFESILSIEYLPCPKSDESKITNSTTAPFSDRLMMYHKALFGSTSIAFYGTAIATCQRADLVVHFSRLVTEMGKYLEDGMNIMIENKWMEEPPLTDDSKELSQQ